MMTVRKLVCFLLILVLVLAYGGMHTFAAVTGVITGFYYDGSKNGSNASVSFATTVNSSYVLAAANTYGTSSGTTGVYGTSGSTTDIYGTSNSGTTGIYGTDIYGTNPAPEIIKFGIPAVEKAVKTELGISQESSIPKSDLEKIKNLDLSGNEITSLSCMQFFPNLVSLNLSNCSISDISSLASLAKLETLNLANNKISDISVFANLTKLGTLNLANNKISNISVLSNLKQLKELGLQSNEISNIDALSGFTGLKKLFLAKNKITDFAPVAAYYKNLQEKDFELIIPIKVKVNGVLLKFTTQPTIISGTTMVPLKVIFDALGVKVAWEGKTKTITATKGKTKIVLKIDSKDAIVNGAKVKLDVAAKIIGGETFVPLRFISTSLGAKIGWDAVTKTATIII